jgi:inner membrane protein
MSATKISDSGVSVMAPLDLKSAKTYKFSFDLNLNGSQSLNFIPLGKETNINLASKWANPSFDGAFLPDQRQVSKDGFTAQWKILSLNRNYPQSFSESDSYSIKDSAFGVKFLVPIDQYQKITRSVKYAIMFIALTFLTFFFVEIFNKKRIHPIQYLLVGFALLVFYTLLLSISEHTNFNFAYILSSIATIILITLYSKAIFKNNFLSLLLGCILIILYGFMYVVLQLQDYALLMGSIGLFIVLAAVMYASRKIDWYSFTFITNNK